MALSDQVPCELVPYGILDLSFKMPDTVLESDYQSGIALLKELGYVPSSEELEEARNIARETGLPPEILVSKIVTEDVA